MIIFSRLSRLLLVGSVFVWLLSMAVTASTGLHVHAQFDDISGCDGVDVSFLQLFNTSQYFPLVPENCGTIGDDNVAAALPISAVPIIMLRGFGALASLTVYLFGFFLVFSGVQYISGGVNPQQQAKAIKNIETSVVAMVMVFSAYTVVNTIAIVLRLEGVANQDVTSFFIT